VIALTSINNNNPITLATTLAKASVWADKNQDVLTISLLRQ
jgi:hypothetical protein